MIKVALRRTSTASASPDEAAGLATSLQASVLNRSGQNMLVEVTDLARLDVLRDTLPGWSFFPQQTPRIAIPYTRLKIAE